MEDLLDNNEFTSAYFQGNLDNEQKLEFENWLESNPISKSKLESYRMIWESTKKLLNEETVSEDRWNKLSKSLQFDESPDVVEYVSDKSEHRYYGILLKIAALIVVVASLLLVANFYSSITVEVPAGATENIQLPDGSRVTLNSVSTLNYNKLDWLLGSREVMLSGEAFFEVLKSNEAFSVKTNRTTTSVLGTSFNIFTRDKQHQIICFSGSVEVEDNKHANKVVLEKGDYIKLDHNSILNPELIRKSDTSFNQPDWIEGEYYYQREPIRNILNEIERRYDLKIVSEAKVDTLLFTGYISNNSADNALKLISLSLGVTFTKMDTDEYQIE